MATIDYSAFDPIFFLQYVYPIEELEFNANDLLKSLQRGPAIRHVPSFKSRAGCDTWSQR